MKNKHLLPVVGLAVLSALTPANSIFAQGSLAPPGAPAPSMKTLAQIEPRLPISSLPLTITNGGSYYLTGSLTGIASASGITISANDVSLDLNGYALIGVPGSLRGIDVPSAQTNVVVANGIIRNWGGAGLNGFSTLYCGRFKDLIVSTNGGHGLAAGHHCLVNDCVAFGNSGYGIEANTGSTVANCSSSYNGAHGFYGQYFMCRDSIASFNNGAGFYLYNYAQIIHCHSSNNTQDGIALGVACHARENTCVNNNSAGTAGYAGIRTFYSLGQVEGNSVQYAAGIGIFVNTNTTLLSTGWSVVRNRTRGPTATAYIYPSGNDLGPIGDAATSTSPWANLRN
jgi:hypothetical protein